MLICFVACRPIGRSGLPRGEGLWGMLQEPLTDRQLHHMVRGCGKGTFLFLIRGGHGSVTQGQHNGGSNCFLMQSWLPPHCTYVQETSIPTNPVRAVNFCKDRVRKGSARFRRRQSSIRNRRLPQQAMPEERRETRNPVFRLRQLGNVRCMRNG